MDEMFFKTVMVYSCRNQIRLTCQVFCQSLVEKLRSKLHVACGKKATRKHGLKFSYY